MTLARVQIETGVDLLQSCSAPLALGSVACVDVKYAVCNHPHAIAYAGCELQPGVCGARLGLNFAASYLQLADVSEQNCFAILELRGGFMDMQCAVALAQVYAIAAPVYMKATTGQPGVCASPNPDVPDEFACACSAGGRVQTNGAGPKSSRAMCRGADELQ